MHANFNFLHSPHPRALTHRLIENKLALYYNIYGGILREESPTGRLQFLISDVIKIRSEGGIEKLGLAARVLRVVADPFSPPLLVT